MRFAYVAADGARRSTKVAVSPRPAEIALEAQRAAVMWAVELGVGDAISIQLTADAIDDHDRPAARTMEQAAADLAAEHRQWVTGCARITSDNELFDLFIDASRVICTRS